MEYQAISPSETALPYAHPPLAPSDPMEERQSGGEVARVRRHAWWCWGWAAMWRRTCRDWRRRRGVWAGKPACRRRPPGRHADEMGFLSAGADADGIPWSKAMLQWLHIGFHFQPEKN